MKGNMLFFDYKYFWSLRKTKDTFNYWSKTITSLIQKNEKDFLLDRPKKGLCDFVCNSNLLFIDTIHEYNLSVKNNCTNVNDSIEYLHYLKFDILSNKGFGESEISEFSGIFPWGYNIFIENQRLINLRNSNISKEFEILSYQKQRLESISLGMEFQRKAIYNTSLFTSAIEYYRQALIFFKEDYFILFRLGIIYLFTPLANIAKAKEYFMEAQKYILPEYYSIRTDQNSGIIAEKDLTKIAEQAAIINYYVGYTFFLQNDLKKAIDNFKLAQTIEPAFGEAKYYLIKALSASDGDKHELKDTIENLLNCSPLYFFKIRKDIFFESNTAVFNITEEWHKQLEIEVQNELNEIGKYKTECQPLIDIIMAASISYRTNTFWGTQNAHSLLNRMYEVKFNALNIKGIRKVSNDVIQNDFILPLLEFDRKLNEQNFKIKERIKVIQKNEKTNSKLKTASKVIIITLTIALLISDFLYIRWVVIGYNAKHAGTSFSAGMDRFILLVFWSFLGIVFAALAVKVSSLLVKSID